MSLKITITQQVLIHCSYTMVIIGIIIGLYYYLKKNRKEPRNIFGVYTRPGKWFFVKYWLFVFFLVIRRIKYYVYGKTVSYNESQLEKLQPLSSHKLACDAVFFQAVSQEGIYICGGIERRHQAKVNGLFYIVLPEYGVLSSEKLPKTTLNADPASLLDHKSYAAEGICFTPVVPMKEWKVAFKGKMRHPNIPNQFVDVDLQAEWKSDLPWFLFETDVPVTNLARAMAREPWSKEFFKSLKEAHQTHYEQMGYLNGTLKVNDKVIPIKEMDAFRDHSFCFKRDWSLMHRYIYHVFYLSDRTKISVGVVCQPCTSTHLEMGYVTHPNGKLDPIESCDLLLYQHGENGILNKELSFTFVADGEFYEVKVKYEYDVVHYKGDDVEAKMNERFFTCEVNGVPGRGISEWHYNNINK